MDRVQLEADIWSHKSVHRVAWCTLCGSRFSCKYGLGFSISMDWCDSEFLISLQTNSIGDIITEFAAMPSSLDMVDDQIEMMKIGGSLSLPLSLDHKLLPASKGVLGGRYCT